MIGITQQQPMLFFGSGSHSCGLMNVKKPGEKKTCWVPNIQTNWIWKDMHLRLASAMLSASWGLLPAPANGGLVCHWPFDSIPQISPPHFCLGMVDALPRPFWHSKNWEYLIVNRLGQLPQLHQPDLWTKLLEASHCSVWRSKFYSSSAAYPPTLPSISSGSRDAEDSTEDTTKSKPSVSGWKVIYMIQHQNNPTPLESCNWKVLVNKNIISCTMRKNTITRTLQIKIRHDVDRGVCAI